MKDRSGAGWDFRLTDYFIIYYLILIIIIGSRIGIPGEDVVPQSPESVLKNIKSLRLRLSKVGPQADSPELDSRRNDKFISEGVETSFFNALLKEMKKFGSYPATLAIIICIVCSAGLLSGEMPAYLLSMGEGKGNFAMVVNKKAQLLCLYQNTSQGPRLEKQYRCTTGKNNNGAKLREGDLKTPNGVYFFRSRLEDEQLPEKYGVRAFPMDYPNDFDKLSDKTGSGIWLHAVDEDDRVEKSYDTEGCVVVTNSDILDLTGYITLWSTPIIVDDSLELASDTDFERERRQVLDFVHAWANCWANKDIDRYMDCYADNFYGYGRNKAQHRAYKQQLNQLYKTIKVTLNDVRAYGFHSYVVVTFLQEYRSDLYHSVGRKRLYLARTTDGYRIFSERIHRM